MSKENITEIQEFKDAFLREANEHLETMNDALLKLEKTPGDMNLVYKIFHAAHSFKSMAALMEYSKTETLCHAMEDVLSGVKKKKIKLEKCIDILFESVDRLEATVKRIAKGNVELDTSNLVKKIRKLASATPSPLPVLSEVEGGGEGRGEGATLDLSASPQDDSGQVDSTKYEIRDTNDDHKPMSTIEVKVERLDHLMNLSEELLVNKMWLDRIKLDLEHPELTSAVDNLDRLVSEVQYDVMQSRLVPIGYVFRRFPRMVRDLAKEQGKKIELKMEGSDIELDRAITDEIGEALVHLLRNSIDHGIEKPEERKKVGKPPEAITKLTALRDKGLAVIEIQDDGHGLDIEEIKRTAVKKGVLTTSASREEVIDTIFQGLSTNKEVTKISGRGFGLNIVKKKVESLGGVIRVETDEKSGTIFRVEVPLTMAVIKSLFVDVGGKCYAVPVTNVVRLVSVNKNEIKGMLDNEAIVLDGEDIPISRLNVLFKTSNEQLATSNEKQPIVIVRKGEDMMGLAVDEMKSTQEIVIKPLNRLLTEDRYANKYFAGSAIIGTGEAILVLDVGNLILSKRGFDADLQR